MNIVTIDMANSIGCCCPYPACGAPRIECESLTASYRATAAVFSDGVYFKQADYEYYWYEDGGAGPFHNYGPAPDYTPYPDVIHVSYRGWNLIEGPCGETDIEEDPLSTIPEDAWITGAEFTTPTSPWIQEDFTAAIIANFEDFAFPLPCTPGTSFFSRLDIHGQGLTPSVLTRSRYRFGVPEEYSTDDAPRSVWEMQWDEVFATSAWWGWYDGGMTGDEPPPGPDLLASREWTWGGEMADPWSEWFALPVPAEAGETRVVNILVRCYRSARLGGKPSPYGDRVALE